MTSRSPTPGFLEVWYDAQDAPVALPEPRPGEPAVRIVGAACDKCDKVWPDGAMQGRYYSPDLLHQPIEHLKCGGQMRFALEGRP